MTKKLILLGAVAAAGLGWWASVPAGDLRPGERVRAVVPAGRLGACGGADPEAALAEGDVTELWRDGRLIAVDPNAVLTVTDRGPVLTTVTEPGGRTLFVRNGSVTRFSPID